MFGGNYASVAKLIKKMYENDVNEIDRTHASVLSECIEMRDRTYQCNSLSQRCHRLDCNLMTHKLPILI